MKFCKSWSIPLAISFHCISQSALAENRVLLVGIEQYQFVAPKLNAPKNDVANMKKLAVDLLGYKTGQITTLLDQQATKEGILSRIKTELIAKTNAGDKVLFYYSGHGYQIKDTNTDEADNKDETLVSYDALSDGSNMITDDELRKLFDQITDRKVTIIIDSCHSGTMVRGLTRKDKSRFIKKPQGFFAKTRSSGSKRLHDITDIDATGLADHRKEAPFLVAAKNRVVWSATAAGQEAYIDQTIPSASPQQSLFTRWFIDGLRNSADANKNHSISHAELLEYTRKKSDEYCQDASHCNQSLGLTPTLEVPDALRYATLLAAPVEDKPGSQFTLPPEIITLPEIADEILPVIDQDSIRIDVEINGKSTHKLHLNDHLFIQVISKKAGYLLLLDQDAQGKLRQLYPSHAKMENKIKANKGVLIPEDSSSYLVTASELGKSKLIAIVTQDKLNLKQLIGTNKDLQPIANVESYLHQLARRLQSTWTGDKSNRAVRYSLAKFAYTVER